MPTDNDSGNSSRISDLLLLARQAREKQGMGFEEMVFELICFVQTQSAEVQRNCVAYLREMIDPPEE